VKSILEFLSEKWVFFTDEPKNRRNRNFNKLIKLGGLTKMTINTNTIYKTMLNWKDKNVKDAEEPTDEWLVRDLLCDLRHFCDEYAIDFDSELSRANNLYLIEIEEESR
jgi:hypothetical protein